MIAIYNDFAEHELAAARWYVKRDAMVAAANRAKWVFNTIHSPQVCQKLSQFWLIAIKSLATETAKQYKQLLQINYPQYLNQDGSVRLSDTGAKTRTQRYYQH